MRWSDLYEICGTCGHIACWHLGSARGKPCVPFKVPRACVCEAFVATDTVQAVLEQSFIAERLYVVHDNSRGEWVHGVFDEVGASGCLIATIPLDGATYAFCDLVEVLRRDGELLAGSIVRRSSWRAVRFRGADVGSRRFRAHVDAIDGLGCITEWTNRRRGAIAYMEVAAKPLARLMHQMQSEVLLTLADA
jgi:hypothetical protein